MRVGGAGSLMGGSWNPGRIGEREIREPRALLKYINGVWIYKRSVPDIVVPAIVSSDSSTNVRVVGLYKKEDVLFFRGKQGGIILSYQSGESFCLEDAGEKALNYALYFGSGYVCNEKVLRAELVAIGDLERTLRREVGDYRQK